VFGDLFRIRHQLLHRVALCGHVEAEGLPRAPLIPVYDQEVVHELVVDQARVRHGGRARPAVQPEQEWCLGILAPHEDPLLDAADLDRLQELDGPG
jgi:hypothetical protein